MAELQWLHSGGAFNKEPDNDLGNYPSQFEISGEPNPQDPTAEPNVMNNLFRDVMPEEAQAGLIDYRCFYIWNSNYEDDTGTPVPQAYLNIILNLLKCDSFSSPTVCTSDIDYGSLFQNDIQQITISCEGFENAPDDGGYVIFECEFGAPFTVYYSSAGNFAQFGSDLQTQLQKLLWCETVTVTGTNPYTVTFNGNAGNRNVQLIRVVQNDLLIKGISRLNTVTYYASDDWNGYGDFQVKTVQPISDYVYPSGNLRIYNPLTGLWDIYAYLAHDSNIFYLSDPLQFNLVGFLGTNPPYANVDDPMNWHRSAQSPETDSSLPVPWGVIEAPLQHKNCQVCIGKTQRGSPINTIAIPIENPYEAPEVTEFTDATLPLTTDALNLRPNEGFYLWIQRTVSAGAGPCLRASFTIQLNATRVDWPITTP